MTTLKGQEELNQYKLTKREVADFLGISTNAVRMSMRGKNCHKLEYRFDGNKYLFKVPQRDTVNTRLVNHRSDLPGSTKATHRPSPGRHKKIYNRGATARGEDNYTSDALRMHNEAKMRIALDKKFKSPEHKKVFMEMTEAGFKEALEISRRTKEKNSRVSPGGSLSIKNYGGMIRGTGSGNNSQLVIKSRLEPEPSLKSFFIGRVPIDHMQDEDVAVEFTQHELDSYGPIKERTEFKSKVEEDIYRAKKALFKKTGEIY